MARPSPPRAFSKRASSRGCQPLAGSALLAAHPAPGCAAPEACQPETAPDPCMPNMNHTTTIPMVLVYTKGMQDFYRQPHVSQGFDVGLVRVNMSPWGSGRRVDIVAHVRVKFRAFTSTSPPQLPFKTPQIPSNRDHTLLIEVHRARQKPPQISNFRPPPCRHHFKQELVGFVGASQNRDSDSPSPQGASGDQAPPTRPVKNDQVLLGPHYLQEPR